VERLGPLAPPERILVVAGEPHVDAIAAQLPGLPPGNILAEPAPRDSCAAIGLAAVLIARRDPEAVMGSFAADHLVRDPDRFAATVRTAVDGAGQGLLMTVGMTPTSPETGFGYLQCELPLEAGRISRVRRFKEKPTSELAAEFVTSAEYLWNASMFVWRVDVFLAELARQQPVMHEGLTRIALAWDTPDRAEVLARVWPDLPRIAVDYAVMEGAAERGLVATVPGEFGWTDVGDFRNLGDLLPPDESGNVVISTASPGADPAPGAVGAPGEVLLVDSRGVVVVPAGGRLVSVLGLKDVVVVDTPDALLVCARDRAQDVKQMVDELKSRGATGRL
jgi:mannose-1-phosphate guanylyltransferase